MADFRKWGNIALCHSIANLLEKKQERPDKTLGQWDYRMLREMWDELYDRVTMTTQREEKADG